MLTEIIDLPSRGNVYPADHPLASGKIEIKYMTTKDEDILSTESYIKNDIVLDKLLESVIVTEGVSADDMISGDREYTLLQTRILAYGNDYSFEINGKRHTVDLSKCAITRGKPDFFKNTNIVEYELPKTGKKVELKVLTNRDLKKINEEVKALEKIGAAPNFITTRLAHIIHSIDGKSDDGYIRKEVGEMLAIESLGIRTFLDSIAPSVDFVTDIDGKEVNIPLGINFFYPTAQS